MKPLKGYETGQRRGTFNTIYINERPAGTQTGVEGGGGVWGVIMFNLLQSIQGWGNIFCPGTVNLKPQLRLTASHESTKYINSYICIAYITSFKLEFSVLCLSPAWNIFVAGARGSHP